MTIKNNMLRLFAPTVFSGLTVLSTACIADTNIFSCSFAQGAWNEKDWLMVRRPDWDHSGSWVQKNGFIENQVPQYTHPEELRGKLESQTHVSMVYKEKVKPGITVSATVQFAERMAPLIVLAGKIGEDTKGRKQYVEQYEIVLFDQGINIWFMKMETGVPFWRKVAYCRFPLIKDTKYMLEVSINEIIRPDNNIREKLLIVKVDGKQEFAYLDSSLPGEFYVGITGCEGVNRFYDFAVQKISKAKK